jgi:hypothetical protein
MNPSSKAIQVPRFSIPNWQTLNEKENQKFNNYSDISIGMKLPTIQLGLENINDVLEGRYTYYIYPCEW